MTQGVLGNVKRNKDMKYELIWSVFRGVTHDHLRVRAHCVPPCSIGLSNVKLSKQPSTATLRSYWFGFKIGATITKWLKMSVFVLLCGGWVLFVLPSKVNRLPFFYGWTFQIQSLMVFQVEVVYIAY